MLSARYLASCSDDLVRLYAQLEHDIVTDMAKRLARVGTVTEATEWQAKILAETGGLKRNIANHLSAYNDEAKRRLAVLFDEALAKNKAADVHFVESAKRSMSDSQRQMLETTAQKIQSAGIADSTADGAIKTFSGLQRLTMTIADTAQEDFIQQANAAYMQTASGAFDYKSALKNAVNNLASKGIHTVLYSDSGKIVHRSIEAAVRANILTGINQTASMQTLNTAQELGVERFEVSAHLGARPEHAEWQGKIFTADELHTICGLGTAGGLCGINCRHSYYPYVEGASALYSDGELDEMKEPRVTLDGREITQYEAEQKLRGIERTVRKYKLQADSLAAIGEDNTAARIKLGEWQSAARDLCRQTGIPRDYSREYVGSADGKQARGIAATATTAKAQAESPNETTRTVASYKNGGAIIAEYAKKTKEESENIEALRYFAEKGFCVRLIKTDNAKRTADALIENEKWEVKTNYTPTASAIDNAIRSCNGQAENLILNIKSNISDEILEKGIKSRIYRTNIKKIIVIKDGKIIKEISRQN